MTKTNTKHTTNYAQLLRFVTTNGAIIVHPNQHIIAKVAQKLGKTK